MASPLISPVFDSAQLTVPAAPSREDSAGDQGEQTDPFAMLIMALTLAPQTASAQLAAAPQPDSDQAALPALLGITDTLSAAPYQRPLVSSGEAAPLGQLRGSADTSALDQLAALGGSDTLTLDQLAALGDSDTLTLDQLAALGGSDTLTLDQLAALGGPGTRPLDQLAALGGRNASALDQLALLGGAGTPASGQLPSPPSFAVATEADTPAKATRAEAPTSATSATVSRESAPVDLGLVPPATSSLPATTGTPERASSTSQASTPSWESLLSALEAAGPGRGHSPASTTGAVTVPVGLTALPATVVSTAVATRPAPATATPEATSVSLPGSLTAPLTPMPPPGTEGRVPATSLPSRLETASLAADTVPSATAPVAPARTAKEATSPALAAVQSEEATPLAVLASPPGTMGVRHTTTVAHEPAGTAPSAAPAETPADVVVLTEPSAVMPDQPAPEGRGKRVISAAPTALASETLTAVQPVQTPLVPTPVETATPAVAASVEPVAAAQARTDAVSPLDPGTLSPVRLDASEEVQAPSTIASQVPAGTVRTTARRLATAIEEAVKRITPLRRTTSTATEVIAGADRETSATLPQAQQSPQSYLAASAPTADRSTVSDEPATTSTAATADVRAAAAEPELSAEVQELRVDLSPPNLGPVTVRLQHHGREVSASLVVDHEQARQVVQQSETQVREALGEQGLRMGAFDVSCRQQGQSEQAPTRQSSLPVASGSPDLRRDQPRTPETSQASSLGSLAAVDVYV